MPGMLRLELNLAAPEGIEPPAPSLGQNASLASTERTKQVETWILAGVALVQPSSVPHLIWGTGEVARSAVI